MKKYRETKKEVRDFIQATLNDLSLEYLTSKKTKINNWLDFKNARIVSGIETDQTIKEKDNVTLTQVNINYYNQSINEIDEQIRKLEKQVKSSNDKS